MGKLYAPPTADLYLCRECHGLGYQTSRVSHDDVEQAELRYRRAFAKADAQDRRPHPNNEPRFPEKPPGMHGETFGRLCSDLHDARQEWADAMDSRMQEFVERTRGLVDGVDERIT